VKSWAKWDGPGQFRLPHAIGGPQQQIYVGDRSNRRIQVFDTEGRSCGCSRLTSPPDPGTRAVNGTRPTGARLAAVIGAPNSICITPGASQG
jgi:hypothetical protein